jgi:hypothetical protein
LGLILLFLSCIPVKNITGGELGGGYLFRRRERLISLERAMF